jgi:hypothetical protein
MAALYRAVASSKADFAEEIAFCSGETRVETSVADAGSTATFAHAIVAASTGSGLNKSHAASAAVAMIGDDDVAHDDDDDGAIITALLLMIQLSSSLLLLSTAFINGVTSFLATTVERGTIIGVVNPDTVLPQSKKTATDDTLLMVTFVCDKRARWMTTTTPR